jgi:hypothetical protein
MELFAFSELSPDESPWLLARVPSATVATMSADRYADQMRILIQILPLVFRRDPNMMRMVCSKRLSKTIPRISHLFHKFKTFSGNFLSIVIFFPTVETSSLDEPLKKQFCKMKR